MTRIGNPVSAEDSRVTAKPKTWFALFQCDNCGYCSLGAMILSTSTYELAKGLGKDVGYALEGDARIEIAARYFDRFDASIQWLPKMALGKRYEDVPEHIASVASEAYSCFSIEMYRAALLMARTALEATAKQCGITEGTLAKKIETMSENNIVPDYLKDEATEIRLLGNDMAHADLDTPVTKDQANEILSFLDSVLDHVYQQPAKAKRRKEEREKAKAGQKQNGK